MIAYNKTWLANLRLQMQVKKQLIFDFQEFQVFSKR